MCYWECVLVNCDGDLVAVLFEVLESVSAIAFFEQRWRLTVLITELSTLEKVTSVSIGKLQSNLPYCKVH